MFLPFLFYLLVDENKSIIRFSDDKPVDIAIFREEEGRYLASCKLTLDERAHENFDDPIEI